MKKMSAYENAQAESGDLPFGAFSNETSAGSDDGTIIVAEHLQDLFYALYQVLQLAGMTPNGSLENGNQSKQFLSALSNIAPILYNNTTTYNKNALVVYVYNDEISFYKSLAASNTASLSDTTKWKLLYKINSSGIFGNMSLLSPALSGTPTAPTAAAGTNTTQIATTAFIQNILSGKIFVIDMGITSNTWYKKYSNGWCEQGGYITSQTNFSTLITFPVPFIDTNYFIMSNGEGPNFGSGGNCGYHTVLKGTKTTTGFNMQTCNGHFSAYFWEAKGKYI